MEPAALVGLIIAFVVLPVLVFWAIHGDNRRKRLESDRQAGECNTSANEPSTTPSVPIEESGTESSEVRAEHTERESTQDAHHRGIMIEHEAEEHNPKPSNEASQIIKPSGTQIAMGVGCFAFALLSFLGFIGSIARRVNLERGVDGGYLVGAMVGALLFCYLCIKGGLKQFRTIVVEEMLKTLDSTDNLERQKAAQTLTERKWEPTDMTQRVKLLVASKKYTEAIALDPMAADRMIDTLKIKNVFDGKMILNVFVKTNCQPAVPFLIELLSGENAVVSKRQITKTLNRLTGQRIGMDHNQWKTWLEHDFAPDGEKR